MEHKVDIDRAAYSHFAKPSASMGYRKVFYTLLAFSSIAFGAFVMAVFYHWNEVQSIDNRMQMHDVKEVIRLTDMLLAKHESNAANVEKLLALFQQHLRMESGSHLNVEADFESNLTFGDLAKDRKQNHKPLEAGPAATGLFDGEEKDNLSPESAKTNSNPADDIMNRTDDQRQSTTPGPVEEKQSAESFHWKFSIPRAGWLQLSPFGISYGTSGESADNQIVSKEVE